MPCVAPATVSALVATVSNGAALAAPRYRGRRGHPVCFGDGYRDALTALSGAHGAREIVAGAGDDLVLLDCDDAGVLIDIDTPTDLGNLRLRPP